MAKNDSKTSDFQSMSDLMEEKKKLEKKMSKVMIPCSHTNANGKLKVNFIKNNLVQCKKCGAKFDFATINSTELDDAIETVHNAVNQIKALSDNPEKEYSVIKELGLMDFNLKEMGELYKKTISSYGKGNNKKKKKKDNAFGNYGTSNIRFL